MQRQEIRAGVREEKCQWDSVVLDVAIVSHMWGKGHLCRSELWAEGLRGAGITCIFCFTKSHPEMEQ